MGGNYQLGWGGVKHEPQNTTHWPLSLNGQVILKRSENSKMFQSEGLEFQIPEFRFQFGVLGIGIQKSEFPTKAEHNPNYGGIHTQP